MKNLTFIISIILYLNSLAQIDTIQLKTKISDVTVFFNGAEITRTKTVNLKAGKQILVIDQLPHDLYPQSIQTKGLKNATILSVKHELVDNSVVKHEDEKAIEKEIANQNEKINALKNEYEVYNIEERFLLDNSQMKKSGNSSDLSNLKNTAEYYRTQLLFIRTQKQNIQQKIESCKDKMKELYTKLNKVTVESRQTKSRVIISLESKFSSSEKIKLSYYIPNAGWEPSYDFRVEEITSPLELVYNANIYQSSGEDWKLVKLKLSSNNPNLDGTIPVLSPWIIGQPRTKMENQNSRTGSATIKGIITDHDSGEPIPFANITIKQKDKIILGSTSDFDGRYTIKPIQSGTYTIEVSYVGFVTSIRTNISCQADKITFTNVALKKGIELQKVLVTEYKSPLFERDNRRPSSTITREELSNMASRSPADISKIAGTGVFSRDNGYDNYSRGSRTGVNYNYIDGVKIIGSANIGDGYAMKSLISNELNDKVINLEYEIKEPYTILSDGEDYALKIKSVEVPAEYVYKAFPSLASDVFLTAQISNWAGLDLLSGKTSIYYQGTFTNESYLDVENAKDTLSISLGRDRNIFIQKRSNQKLYDKYSLGNNYKESIVWDIQVKNNKTVPVKIIVRDQYPISPRKSISVELQNLSNAQVDQKRSYLTWKLDLKPNEKKEIQYGINLKYPKFTYVDLD